MVFEKMIRIMTKAYISVYGIEKWNSLTNKEKHDAIMMMAHGMHEALTNK